MPVTYYTEEEVQEFTRLLAECYRHISDGDATELARNNILSRIAKKLGWQVEQAHNRVMAQKIV